MIAAGLALCLGALQPANAGLPFTVGQAFDLLPIAIFLHVFLAFPTGRLRSRPERMVVGFGYLVAVGLQLVGLLLGGFGPDNVIAVVSAPDAAQRLFDFQLLALAGACLGGLAVLVARKRREPRMRRRSAQLLVDLFAVVLVMCAALLLMGLFWPRGGLPVGPARDLLHDRARSYRLSRGAAGCAPGTLGGGGPARRPRRRHGPE